MSKYKITIENENFEVIVMKESDDTYKVNVDNKEYKVNVQQIQETINRNKEKNIPKLNVSANRSSALDKSSKIMYSPVCGIIKKVYIKKTQKVDYDSLVVMIEAMKIENEIYSDITGTVNEIYIKEDDIVKKDSKLFECM